MAHRGEIVVMCRGRSHAWPQPPDSDHARVCVSADRYPLANAARVVEAWWRDAHNRVRPLRPGVREMPTDDAGVTAELVLPEGVAQHHRMQKPNERRRLESAADFILWREQSPEKWPDSQDPKENAGDDRLLNENDAAVLFEGVLRGAPVYHTCDVAQRARLPAEGIERLLARRPLHPVLVCGPECDEPVLIDHRQWLDEHGADDGEHRHGHPDADSKNEHGGRGKGRRTAKPT